MHSSLPNGLVTPMSGALRSPFPSDISAQVPNPLLLVAVAKLPLEIQQELLGYAGWI